MHPHSCGKIKKLKLNNKIKKENCSNISQSLGSFKNPTTGMNTQVLTRENVAVCTLIHSSVHSYRPPVLTMARVQTRVDIHG